MERILNFGMAWISVFLAALLAVVYILRKKAREYPSLQMGLEQLNRFLRRHHKALGLVLIATGLIHGLFSSEKVWTLNLGTIAWLLSVLLGLNWLLKKELPTRKGWMHAHRALTVAFSVVLLMHLANVGVQAPMILLDRLVPSTMTAGLAAGNAAAGSASGGSTVGGGSVAVNPVTDNTAATSAPEQKLNISSGDLATVRQTFAGVTLKDGTYQGSATGYGANLTVSVVVKAGAVTSVQVVSHNEVNSRYYARPIQLLPQAIVAEQDLDVDLVAGATFTSVGIVNAVRAALVNAVSGGTLPEALSLPVRGRKR